MLFFVCNWIGGDNFVVVGNSCSVVIICEEFFFCWGKIYVVICWYKYFCMV